MLRRSRGQLIWQRRRKFTLHQVREAVGGAKAAGGVAEARVGLWVKVIGVNKSLPM